MPGDSAASPGYAVMAGGWKNAKAPDPSNVYPRNNVDKKQKSFVIVNPNTAWGRKLKGLLGWWLSSSSALNAMPDLVGSIDDATGFVRYSKPAVSSHRPDDVCSANIDDDSVDIAPSEVTLINQPSVLSSGDNAPRGDSALSEEYFIHVRREPWVKVTVYRDAPSAEAGGVEVGEIQPVKPTFAELRFARKSAGFTESFHQDLFRSETFVKTWPCELPAVNGGSAEPSYRWKKFKRIPGGWMLSDAAGQYIALGTSKGSGDEHSGPRASLKILRDGLDRTAVEQILVTWVTLERYMSKRGTIGLLFNK